MVLTLTFPGCTTPGALGRIELLEEKEMWGNPEGLPQSLRDKENIERGLF